MKTLCLISLCMAFQAHFAQAQFTDTFADSNLHQHPVWQGDSSHFRINHQLQLQLQAPTGSSRSILSTSSRAIHEARWEWWMQLDFNPSSANYADVYLTSDRPELDSALQGYFVRIGNTTDEISLYRQNGSTRTKIIDGTDGMLDKQSNQLRIQVLRNAFGWWELRVDTSGTGQNYRTEGSVLDVQHTLSSWFGLRLVYSASRANQFYFDDFLVTGQAIPDTIAPRITQALLVGNQALQLHFSKILAPTERSRLSAYALGTQGSPFRATAQGDSSVLLEWLLPFAQPAWIHCEVRLTDSAGNLLDTTVRLLHHPYEPGQIKITELLADPSPSAGLPETEMVELYNASSFDVSLRHWQWTDGQTTVPLPDTVLAAGHYLLLVPAASTTAWQPYSPCIGLTNWPSLNNETDMVWLTGPDGRNSDSLRYQSQWLGTPARMAGGYTLERVDLNSPCQDNGNWTGSLHPLGGTPGQSNSVNGQFSEVPKPSLLLIRVLPSDTMVLQFSSAVGGGQIHLNEHLIELLPNQFTQVLKVPLPLALQAAEEIQLTCEAVADCRGQLVEDGHWTWKRPDDSKAENPVFSEIYYRPAGSGTPFVELYLPGQHARQLQQLWLTQRNEWGDAMASQPLGEEGDAWSPHVPMVFCRDTAALQNDFGEVPIMNRRQLSSSLGVLSGGGWLTVETAAGDILAATSYHDSLHHPMLQETRGRSLEKVIGDWHGRWGSSQGLVRGSPGQPNSRRFVNDMVSGKLHLSKHVVQPALLDPILVVIKSEKPRMMELELWTAEGKKAGVFMPSQLIEGTTTLSFDGYLEGNLLATGGYFLLLRYFDLEVQTGTEVQQVVVNNLRP